MDLLTKEYNKTVKAQKFVFPTNSHTKYKKSIKQKFSFQIIQK